MHFVLTCHNNRIIYHFFFKYSLTHYYITKQKKLIRHKTCLRLLRTTSSSLYDSGKQLIQGRTKERDLSSRNSFIISDFLAIKFSRLQIVNT